MWVLLRPFEFILLIKEGDKANNFTLLLYEKIIWIETWWSFEILPFCHIFNVGVMSNDLTLPTKINVDVAADVKHSMYLLI